jgi:hypothetical protein
MRDDVVSKGNPQTESELQCRLLLASCLGTATVNAHHLLDFSTILSTVLGTFHAGGTSTINGPRNLAFEETLFLSSPNCYPMPKYLIVLLTGSNSKCRVVSK